MDVEELIARAEITDVLHRYCRAVDRRDPDLLRSQVTITVRHELAHHIGFDELGVRGLGL